IKTQRFSFPDSVAKMDLSEKYEITNEWHVRHPTFIIVSGPTFSGKSTFVANLLRNNLIHPSPERIYFVFSEEQSGYFDLLRQIVGDVPIEFIHGLPSAELVDLNPEVRNLMIFDDLMQEVLQSKYFLDLTTKMSHHRNTSVILTTQNLYMQGKFSKTI